jgi:hypothetical protein
MALPRKKWAMYDTYLAGGGGEPLAKTKEIANHLPDSVGWRIDGDFLSHVERHFD